MGDLRVVWKLVRKGCALLLAKRGEVWIMQLMICFVEIVISLCVADTMNCCFAHIGGMDLFGG